MKNTFSDFFFTAHFLHAQSISKSVIGMAGKTQSNGGLSFLDSRGACSWFNDK
jgi:hypothetical protein